MTLKIDKNNAKIFYRKLAFAVFATLTPHRQPTPKNGLRHFSALPTHHPNKRIKHQRSTQRNIKQKKITIAHYGRNKNFYLICS